MIAWAHTLTGPQLVRVLEARDGIAKVHRVKVQMHEGAPLTVQKVGGIWPIHTGALRWYAAVRDGGQHAQG